MPAHSVAEFCHSIKPSFLINCIFSGTFRYVQRNRCPCPLQLIC
jgi:hypothetical protein